MDPRILDKIRKCLAHARNENANERETALRQARALMDKHGVTEADIAAAEVAAELVDAGVKAPPAWLTRLANTCAHAFGCQAVFHEARRGTGVSADIEFIGLGAGPQVGAYAYEVLHGQLKRERKAHVAGLSARCKPATRRRRGDEFAHGFVDGVVTVVRQFAGPDEATRTAIAAYKQQKYSGKLETKAVGRGRQLARDSSSRHAGHEAGGAAQLHHGVGGSAQPAGLLEG